MKGFTLIELMIVVAIIGILAAIIVPAFTEAGCTKNSRDKACVAKYQREQQRNLDVGAGCQDNLNYRVVNGVVYCN